MGFNSAFKGLNSNIRTIRIDAIFQLARSVKVKTTLELTIVYDLTCIKKNCARAQFEGMWKGEWAYSTIHSYFRHFIKTNQLHVPPTLLQGKRTPGTHLMVGGGGEWAPQAVWTLWITDSTGARIVNQTKI